MALPLPKVVSDVGPGGPMVTALKGMNSLSGQMLDNHIKGVKAQYAPYTEYANAAAKTSYANMLPYQIQSTILSNPLIWQALKDNPNALNGMLKDFSQSFPKGGQPFGNVNIPIPGQQGPGIFGRIKNFITGGGSQGMQQPGMQMPNNAMQQQPSMPMQGQDQQGLQPGNQPSIVPDQPLTTPTQPVVNAPKEVNLSPSSNSPIEGVNASMTSKYNEEPFTPGSTATINGQNISVPAGSTRSDVQRALIGIRTVAPILKRVSDGAEEFLSKGQKGQSLVTQINDNIQQYGNIDLIPDFIKKKLGLDSDKLSRYTKWQSDIEKLPESMVKAFDMPQGADSLHRIDKIIKPVTGEMGPGYKKRVDQELEELLNERAPMYSSIMRSGINVDKVDLNKVNLKSTPAQTPKAATKPANKPTRTGADILSKKITLPSFRDQAHFQEWYSKQPLITQKAVKEYLGNK